MNLMSFRLSRFQTVCVWVLCGVSVCYVILSIIAVVENAPEDAMIAAMQATIALTIAAELRLALGRKRRWENLPNLSSQPQARWCPNLNSGSFCGSKIGFDSQLRGIR